MPKCSPGPLERLIYHEMMKILAALYGALVLVAPLRAADLAPANKRPPKILIKVDDFGAGKAKNISPQWQRLIDFIKARKLKVNIGVIANCLENASPTYLQWMKDLHSTGLAEFWLHAYDHQSWTAPDGVQYNEFVHRPYEEQLQRLERCQKLAKERLGFVFTTFGPPGTGAPGPGTDENTYRAMQAEPNMKVWLYGSPIDDAGKALEAQGKITILDRVWRVNIEHPLFKPSADEFQKGYGLYADKRDYFVIQGHPQHWTDEGFAEFVKIVDFAVAQGCTFVSPTEYAATLKSTPAHSAAVSKAIP